MTEILEAPPGLTEVDTLDVPEGYGLMSFMSARHGDLRLMWDKGNPEEVRTARETFDRMVKREKHVAHLATGKEGKLGEMIREFDPDAERIIFRKQTVGG